jgi:hypothetical protein
MTALLMNFQQSHDQLFQLFWQILSVSLQKILNFIQLQILKYLSKKLSCMHGYHNDLHTNFRDSFWRFWHPPSIT